MFSSSSMYPSDPNDLQATGAGAPPAMGAPATNMQMGGRHRRKTVRRRRKTNGMNKHNGMNKSKGMRKTGRRRR
jgi:hypothetical protein